MFLMDRRHLPGLSAAQFSIRLWQAPEEVPVGADDLITCTIIILVSVIYFIPVSQPVTQPNGWYKPGKVVLFSFATQERSLVPQTILSPALNG